MSLEGAVTCDDVINNIFERLPVNKDFMQKKTMLKLPNICSRIFLLFNFQFGQEAKVKFMSPMCKYF